MTHTNQLLLTIYARKSANDKLARLYIKVRVSGLGEKRLSANVTVPVSNFKNGKITGRNAQVLKAEQTIHLLKEMITDSYWDLIKNQRTPSPDLVIQNIETMRKAEMTLLELMDIIIEQKNEMVSHGQASKALPEKIKVLKGNLKDFCYAYYKRTDLYLYEITLDFVNRFSNWLKHIPNGNVTINKKISNLSQALNYGQENQWIPSNPAKLWKNLPEPNTNNEYLTIDQVKALMDFRLPNSSYEIVKDTFIFMCFTGLAYADVKSFNFSKVTDINGDPVIDYTRSKTKKPVRVPLLPVALDLILKYYSRPIRKGRRDMVLKSPKDPIFPIQANATYNEKLKTFFEYNEMELDFDVSSHSGRKTFGNMITQLLSITDASQLLGHSSIDITEESYVNNFSDELLSKRSSLMKENFEMTFKDNKKL